MSLDYALGVAEIVLAGENVAGHDVVVLASAVVRLANALALAECTRDAAVRDGNRELDLKRRWRSVAKTMGALDTDVED